MIRTFISLLIALCAFAAHAAVDVNKASQAELETIKGIGPSMSGRMLDERKKGAFKDWPDMVARVKGVGEGNASRFSADGLTVNGSAYKDVAVASSKPAGRTAGSDKKSANDLAPVAVAQKK
jgi:competence protein ComEA